jgi:hypothetical protein
LKTEELVMWLEMMMMMILEINQVPKKLINYLLAPLELDAAALSQRPEDSCSFVETEDIFGPVSTIFSLSLSLAVLLLTALGFSWHRY